MSTAEETDQMVTEGDEVEQNPTEEQQGATMEAEGNETYFKRGVSCSLPLTI